MKAAFKSIIPLLVIAVFLKALPLHAEDPATAQPVQQPQQQQPKQESDRGGGSGAAKAAAIAGAAIAGVGCIMMMNEARKMPPGKEKTQTMMMAMQQCAQAAQSAAAAAQNDKAKKAVSQSDVPKMASLPPSKAPAEQKSTENPALPTTEEKKEEIASIDPIPEPGPLTTPELEEPKIVESEFTGEAGFGPEISISALKPIEASRVDFNEGNKNNTPTITPPGLGGNGFFGGGKPVGIEELKKLSTTDASVASGKAGRSGKGEEEAPASGSSDSGGGSSKDEGGNSAFDQLLNQLMGGGQPAEGLNSGGLRGTDLVALPKNKATGQGPNIFEYASYRYRVATYDESRLTVKRKAEASRTITSEKSPTLARK